MERIFWPAPTRQGGFFLLSLLGIVLGGINYNNNLALLLGFLFFGGIAASALHTRAFAKSLSVRFSGAAPVFAGEEARFEFILAAPFASHSVWAGFDGQAQTEVALRAGQGSTVFLTVAAGKRGTLLPGPVTVRTRYPLGLFQVRRVIVTQARCLVYPRPFDGALSLPEGGSGAGEGEPAGPGVDDFGGLRAYIPGDPPQRVAWKVSSRGHGLQTKEFFALSGLSPMLDWHTLPGADPEIRLSMLCRMLLLAEERGQSYGLRLPAAAIAPDSGKNHLHRCLRELALFRMTPP